MSIRFVLSVLVFVIACGGGKSSAPPPAAPAPAPVSAETPAPAPAPAPTEPAAAPTPASPPDRKPDVVAILDKIDHQLEECEHKKMHHVEPHAESIVQLVDQLAEPIADFPNAADSYAKLKEQAAKFEVACKKEKHKDQHHHHHELADLTKAIRSQL